MSSWWPLWRNVTPAWLFIIAVFDIGSVICLSVAMASQQICSPFPFTLIGFRKPSCKSSPMFSLMSLWRDWKFWEALGREGGWRCDKYIWCLLSSALKKWGRGLVIANWWQIKQNDANIELVMQKTVIMVYLQRQTSKKGKNFLFMQILKI